MCTKPCSCECCLSSRNCLYVKVPVVQMDEVKRSRTFLLACFSNEHSYEPTTIPAHRMTYCSWVGCLAEGWREKRRKIFRKTKQNKITALCSENKWLPARDEPVSSPHLHIPVSVDNFSVMGAFAYFLHSDAVLHLQMIAFIWPAEESEPAAVQWLITKIIGM